MDIAGQWQILKEHLDDFFNNNFLDDFDRDFFDDSFFDRNFYYLLEDG